MVQDEGAGLIVVVEDEGAGLDVMVEDEGVGLIIMMKEKEHQDGHRDGTKTMTQDR